MRCIPEVMEDVGSQRNRKQNQDTKVVVISDPCRSFRSPPSLHIVNLSASKFFLGTFFVYIYLVALRDLFRYLRVAVIEVKA